VQNIGPVSYMIQPQDGTVHKRHLDHIDQQVDNPSTPTSSSNASQATEKSPLVSYPVEPLSADSELSQSEQSQLHRAILIHLQWQGHLKLVQQFQGEILLENYQDVFRLERGEMSCIVLHNCMMCCTYIQYHDNYRSKVVVVVQVVIMVL